MAMVAGKWGPHWEQAKKEFEKSTKKKKPKASVEEKMSKKSGISALLKSCDKAYLAAMKFKDGKKTKEAMGQLEELKTKSAEFAKVGNAYWMDIQAEMVKAKDTHLMNEMDVLRKEIDALRDSITQQTVALEAGIKQIAIVDQMASGLKVAIEASCKRALLFVAQVRARKNVKVWNDGILTASRDVYQQLANIEILRKKKLDTPGIPDSTPPGLAHLKSLRDGKIKFSEGQETEMETANGELLKVIQAVVDWMKKG